MNVVQVGYCFQARVSQMLDTQKGNSPTKGGAIQKTTGLCSRQCRPLSGFQPNTNPHLGKLQHARHSEKGMCNLVLCHHRVLYHGSSKTLSSERWSNGAAGFMWGWNWIIKVGKSDTAPILWQVIALGDNIETDECIIDIRLLSRCFIAGVRYSAPDPDYCFLTPSQDFYEPQNCIRDFSSDSHDSITELVQLTSNIITRLLSCSVLLKRWKCLFGTM